MGKVSLLKDVQGFLPVRRGLTFCVLLGLLLISLLPVGLLISLYFCKPCLKTMMQSSWLKVRPAWRSLYSGVPEHYNAELCAVGRPSCSQNLEIKGNIKTKQNKKTGSLRKFKIFTIKVHHPFPTPPPFSSGKLSPKRAWRHIQVQRGAERARGSLQLLSPLSLNCVGFLSSPPTPRGIQRSELGLRSRRSPEPGKQRRGRRPQAQG